MVGGVVMVVVAYLYGSDALVTATAVTALVVMLWLLRRGIDGYVKNVTASVFTLVYVPVPRAPSWRCCSPRVAAAAVGSTTTA